MGLNTERRDFLTSSLYWSLGVLGLHRLQGLITSAAFPSSGPTDSRKEQTGRKGETSTIVICHDDGVRRTGGGLDEQVMDRMLEAALLTLTGAPSAAEAWRRFVHPGDILGVKVNCLAGRGLSTHPELVRAMVRGLQSAGIAGERIIIWDRLSEDLQRAGYTLKMNGKGPRCYGNDTPGADYERDLTVIGSVGSRLSRILTRQCTAIINVPVLKDHSIAGISVSLKNFFGAIDNPNKYHRDGCNPYVADLCAVGAIASKSRLIICDALTAQYEGGPPYMPQWAWPMNSIIVGTDPVALDQVAWETIESKRKEAGLPSLAEAGREPVYIATAADEQHGLGWNDPRRIKVIRTS